MTGDAAYFLLTEKRRKDLQLPIVSMTPVLSKARHLVYAEITKASFQKLRDADHRVWLFRPGKKALSHSAVQKYLKTLASQGGCQKRRFKISHREIWHKTPLPPKPHGFISGMSDAGPYICFNAMPRLTASNTLYTIRFRTGLSSREMFSIALALLTSSVRSQVNKAVRRYAGGLRKLEPKDLADLHLPMEKTFETSKEIYNAAITTLWASGVRAAQRIANKHFAKK